MLNDVTDESQVNLYNQWLWLTPDDILALQYCPNPSKQKIVPLSRGYHTHVTRFKAMYSELQLNPGWTDLDIFKITYDEYMAFSRQYMAGQVTLNLQSTASNLNASSTDLVALFTKLIVESKEKVAPKGIVDKDIGGDDAITAKGIKEIPSISSRLLAIPTTVLPSEGDTNGVLNIIGDAAQGNFKSAENFRHPSPMSVLSSMMFAVDPPLSSFHRGHQALSSYHEAQGMSSWGAWNQYEFLSISQREKHGRLCRFWKCNCSKRNRMSYEYCIQVYGYW
jgi:hypothetical protein